MSPPMESPLADQRHRYRISALQTVTSLTEHSEGMITIHDGTNPSPSTVYYLRLGHCYRDMRLDITVGTRLSNEA